MFKVHILLGVSKSCPTLNSIDVYFPTCTMLPKELPLGGRGFAVLNRLRFVLLTVIWSFSA